MFLLLFVVAVRSSFLWGDFFNTQAAVGSTYSPISNLVTLYYPSKFSSQNRMNVTIVHLNGSVVKQTYEDHDAPAALFTFFQANNDVMYLKQSSTSVTVLAFNYSTSN
eukprot:TRINITY_DN14943_c0_g1_i2.p1 TRINITY_DN14943_c0_g1~~TRINITY_DN14943_c0_g1_i2.p1  ORF type:complete len:108 (+),score=5.17 TRINITY_DN14943_c0_g1_i2:78-401(+)